MQVSHKILIDRLIGQPIAWGLNFAARALGRLLRRNHSNDPIHVHTIVFAKYLGMGSIIQATPLIRSVHVRYPQARIIFLTGRSCAKLVERLEYIDKVLVIDDSSLLRVAMSSLSATRALMKAKVDLFFDLEIYSFYASIMALVSLARNRIGFFRESAEHKRGNYTHLVFLNTRYAVRHTYLQQARLIGCQPIEENRLGLINITAEDEENAQYILNHTGICNSTYFIVNPNASDLILERRWPSKSFAETISHIVRMGYQVVLSGTKEERTHNATVYDLLPDDTRTHVFNLAGDLPLGTFLAVLRKAHCILTNDTGPMHIAWALGVPTISLFGPCSPDQYGWDSPINISLYHRVYCSPCVHEIDVPPCRGNNVCMQRISVQAVAEALHKLLNRENHTPSQHFEASFFVDEQGAALGKVVPHKPYPEVS